MSMRDLVDRLLGRRLYRRPKRRCLTCGIDAVESLESRLVLFATTGNAWPTPQLVTISFEPDGTNLGGVTSNLNSAFDNNANLAGQWQTEIIRAAQAWGQVTNINFVVVSDNGAPSGSGNYQQGDPGFGDIRIGGYNFGNSSLARAYQPPPENNFSIAGDIVFNTGAAFGIGSGYDLFTVAAHEFGHALGLDHTSATTTAEMWSSYNAIKPNLSADDIAGIRSIYSGGAPRTPDNYDASGSNNTIGTADDISGKLVRSQAAAIIPGLDITTNSDVDFYKVSIPRWTGKSMVVTVQSAGLSLLSPHLTVYAADQKTILGTADGKGEDGTTLNVTIPGVSNNDVYYIQVTAADGSVFGVGNYGLIVNLGSSSSPVIASPRTTMANGSQLSGGGGAADGSGVADTIFANAPVIESLTPDTGMSATDRTTNVNQIVLTGVAPVGSQVDILRDGVTIGSFLNISGLWNWPVPSSLADGHYTFTARNATLAATDPAAHAMSDGFTVTIDTVAPDAPVIAPGSGNGSSGTTSLLTGTAEAGSLITVYENAVQIGTTTTDGFGNWTFTLPAQSSGKHTYAATATDQAGNVSLLSDNANGNGSSTATATSGGSTTLTITPLVPTASTTALSTPVISYVTTGSTLTARGVAVPNSTIQLFINTTWTVMTVADNQGHWSVGYNGPQLPAGIYTLTAIARDQAGNTSSASSAYKVMLGNLAPTASNLRLQLASSLATPTITGVATNAVSVSLYDGNVYLGSATVTAGKWIFTTPTLQKGTHNLVAVATDGQDYGFASSPLTISL